MSRPEFRSKGKGRDRKVHPVHEPSGYAPRGQGSPTADGITREDLRERRSASLGERLEKKVKEHHERSYGKTRTPSRREWAMQRWFHGHSGAVDFGLYHHQVDPNISMGKKTDQSIPRRDIDGEHDIKKLDRPRGDILKFKGKHGRMLYVGGTNQKVIRSAGQTLMNVQTDDFTTEELRSMGGIFVDIGKGEVGRGSAATCMTVVKGPATGNSFIAIRPGHEDDEGIMVHEMIHAYRNATGRRPRDVNTDELMTELETVARIQEYAHFREQAMSGIGYYPHLPEVKAALKTGDNKAMREAIRVAYEHDFFLLRPNYKPLKGKRAIEKVKAVYPQSKISQARFSPGEKVDRYFYVDYPGAGAGELHMRYEKPPTKAEIMKEFRTDWPPGTKVWEYVDGKKVKLI